MVIKSCRSVFFLLWVFTLTCAMRCDTDHTIYPIEELRNAKVYGTLSPEKEIYQVGDTIELRLRVTPQDLNNWRHFDKAGYQVGYIFKLAYLPNEDWFDLVELVELNVPARPTRAPNGDSYIEFIVKYKLLKARTYSWGRRCGEYETGESCYSSLLVDYQGNRNYAMEVPIYFTNNNQQELTIKVTE